MEVILNPDTTVLSVAALRLPPLYATCRLLIVAVRGTAVVQTP